MASVFFSFLCSLFSLLLIDGFWLFFMVKYIYFPNIGHLMAPTLNMFAAAIFYPLYAMGLTFLVIMPGIQSASTYSEIFIKGAFLGLISYGTYDLTNHATLKDWPAIVTIVDMAWGAFLSGIVCTIGLYVNKFFFRI